jgi:hypothetical protein
VFATETGPAVSGGVYSCARAFAERPLGSDWMFSFWFSMISKSIRSSEPMAPVGYQKWKKEERRHRNPKYQYEAKAYLLSLLLDVVPTISGRGGVAWKVRPSAPSLNSKRCYGNYAPSPSVTRDSKAK